MAVSISKAEDKKLKLMESMEERLNKLKSRMSSLGLTDDDSEDNFSYILSFIDVVRDRINEDSKNEYGFTKNYTESSFYSILSVIESMQDVSFVDGYYPTVDQLKIYRIDKNIPKYLHMLLFYATDPFGRTGAVEKDEEEYKKLVRYCKTLTAEVSLKIS